MKAGANLSEQAQESIQEIQLYVQDLQLHFGGVVALDHVNLQVKSGEIIALIGPNGAGKTSMLNCISGFYKAQAGKIVFDGKNITSLLPPYRRPVLS